MSQVILSGTGILSFMDEEAREKLASYGQVVATKAGEVLIREGDVQSQLYIVLIGRFNITTRVQGNDVHLDVVGAGDCLGEVAIFNPDRASATATSLENGQLWAIDAVALQEFLLDWPHSGCAAILGINIILSRRLKRANAMIRAHEIVPAFLSVRSSKRAATGKLS